VELPAEGQSPESSGGAINVRFIILERQLLRRVVQPHRRQATTGVSFMPSAKVATRKLAQLDAAQTLEFLRSPPGNRLEALKGERKGQFSIRINDQYRLCFRWTNEGLTDVELVDYH
jgi:proteic killer suppression protein